MESVQCLLMHIQFIYNETVHVPWCVVYRPTAKCHRDISHVRSHTQRLILFRIIKQGVISNSRAKIQINTYQTLAVL